MVPFSRYLDDSTFIQVSSLKTKLKNTMKIQNEISRDTKNGNANSLVPSIHKIRENWKQSTYLSRTFLFSISLNTSLLLFKSLFFSNLSYMWWSFWFWSQSIHTTTSSIAVKEIVKIVCWGSWLDKSENADLHNSLSKLMLERFTAQKERSWVQRWSCPPNDVWSLSHNFCSLFLISDNYVHCCKCLAS